MSSVLTKLRSCVCGSFMYKISVAQFKLIFHVFTWVFTCLKEVLPYSPSGSVRFSVRLSVDFMYGLLDDKWHFGRQDSGH